MMRMGNEKMGRSAAIILAGGKGTRMGDPDKHKCLYDMGEQPAIYDLIDKLRNEGITTNVLVIGALSDQLMSAMSEKYNDVAFAYQPSQIGTGNAAKYGVRILKNIGFTGAIYIIPGDTYLENEVIQNLSKDYRESNADLALLVKYKKDEPFFGRIIQDDEGNVIASLEFWDIHKVLAAKEMKNLINEIDSQISSKYPTLESVPDEIFINLFDKITQILKTHFLSEKKINLIYPNVSKIIKNTSKYSEHFNKLDKIVNNVPLEINIKGKSYDVEELEEKVKYVNISFYMFRSEPLYKYIESIEANNAQKEEYLTDMIQTFNENNCKIIATPIDFPEQSMAFNSPEELRKINEYIKNGKK
jgi:bifunctional N-acetylglucosamine-1-phosphate-uridyltransferase/glucosamine-1-phosphate-acetyltransferase GlmU-like protein